MRASGIRDAADEPAAAGCLGRAGELSALVAARAAAAAGGARCVVIEGAPGIGKTALVRRFLAGLEEGGAVLATAEAAEALVDYALADQLLRALGVERPDVIARDGGAADFAAVGLRLLEALSGAAASGPPVVAVDDAQWADAASLRALLFAVRRVAEEEGVLVVLAVRDDGAERIPPGFSKLDAFGRMQLDGLGDDEVRALAAAAGCELSVRAARRLQAHTRGNPLYVRALLDEVPASAWEERELPQPAPELFAQRVVRLLEASPPQARALIEAAAVLGVRSELQAAAVVGVVGEPLQALEQAQGLGLLAADPRSHAVVFDHPLTRSAVYHALGPARRARLHAAAAEVVGHPGLALRHRAAGAAGPDPRLAAELEAFATGETRRSAWDSVAESLSAAARVSDAEQRERLELEAADALLSGGRTSAARARLAGRDEEGADALLLCVLAHAALLEGRMDDAERLLARAWERDDGDREVRRLTAERHAAYAMSRLRPDDVLTWAARSAELAPDDRLGRLLATWPVAIGLAMKGEHREGLARLDRILDSGALAAHDVGFRAVRGSLRLRDDDVAGALEDLRAVASPVRQLGAETLEVVIWAWLARAELAAGAWDAAAPHAERALAIAVAGDIRQVRPEAHVTALLLAVARGELAAAEQHVAALRDGGTTEAALVQRVTGEALLAAARAQPQDVLAALEPLRAAGLERHLLLVGDLRLPALRADALVRLGRLDDAEAVLRAPEARAAERELRALGVVLGRVRGRLEAARGRNDAAQRAFAQALDAAGSLRMPFELALSRLAHGQFLRRRGQRHKAVALLSEARDGFAQLGARPALEQCERELAASGLAPARRTAADRATLTGRERAVAQLAARGLTNREIAAELMVSVKTIEVHLSRVFAKLDVTARGEISQRLDRA